MKLLVVDDEYLVVEEIKTAIDWEKLGISDILTAFDIHQAKDIFAKNTIDIMLCDIEMPGGSGLELLSWVRDNYPKTESLFLTCHADFGYAREAIRLGCLEYILKPVPYAELEAAIAKAIDKIKKDDKLLEDSRYGKYWFKHLPVMIERFWYDIVKRNISSTQEDIKKAAEERNIPYSEKMRFLPVLLCVRRWHENWSLNDKKIMEFAIKNIAGEIILKDGANGQIIEYGEDKFVILLYLWSYPGLNNDMLKKDCESCIAACHQHLQCDLSCYIGNEVYAHEIPSMVDRLFELETNNILYDNKVLLLDIQDKVSSPVNLPDMNIWSVMLTNGSYDKLLHEVNMYLSSLPQRAGLNANILKQFHYDFMQMFYYVLKQKNIQAHLLLSDSESMKLHDKAVYSVKDMIAWISHAVRKAEKYSNEIEESQSAIKKAKEYIRQNIFKDIARQEIARHLYLNPDYLDRIFKKETGLSVTKFLLKERLNIAQELLSKTEMPVSAIAASIGFKNTSYFSTLFKKHIKMSPDDFRKTHLKIED